MSGDRNCLSYWFPKALASGVPVPKTVIVKAPDLSPWLRDDNASWPELHEFMGRLKEAAKGIGYPVFLRTGHGSGKHEWERTCFVPSESVLERHVFAIFEWSHMVDFMGLPTDVWVVRELLKTAPIFEAFDGFPVTKERRWFVRDGEVVCFHPYWPEKAVEEGRPYEPGKGRVADWRDRVRRMNFITKSEVDSLFPLTRRVAAHLQGFWSVDWLWVEKRGWVLIDMAEGERSFHMEDCPHATKGEPS